MARGINHPIWVSHEGKTHRFSEEEPLRLHATMNRGTTPNHIHIILRFTNINSGTLFMHEKFISNLVHVSIGDRRPHKLIICKADSFVPDSLRRRHSHPSSIVSGFSTGTSTGLGKKSRSPAPAAWRRDSSWFGPTTSAETKLYSVLTDMIFSVEIETRGYQAIRLSRSYMGGLTFLFIRFNLSNFDWFVCH